MPRYSDHFDYEDARMDIFDMGADPDYLDSRDPEKRDKYMRSLGMDPKKYGSRWDEYQASLKKNEKKSDDDCYLTTACIRSKGLPDHCRELTLLRHFGTPI